MKDRMNALQKLFTLLVPRSWAADMEAESRRWVAHCDVCGHERSIWDLGGIRWKAVGNPRRWMRCPQCGKTSWHVVQRKTSP
jgi:hypothetical protein